MMIKWLSINIHLIPSYACFITGLLLLVLAPIMYQIRKKKIIILNPIKAIKEYDQAEKRIFIIGAILLVTGLASSIVIEETFGYYYFKNGVPTLLKK